MHHSLGLPSCGKSGRLEKKGANITHPQDQETTNLYNENDSVSTLVHELAFDIVICFGSTKFRYIYAILYIDTSLHSPTTQHASASPTAFFVYFWASRLACAPDL